MASEHAQKISFSTGKNRSGSINTPRFAAQAAHRGHSSTAERHTWPTPGVISSQNSAEEWGNNVSGSYPQEDMPWVSQMLKKHHDVDNPRHLGTMKVDLPLEEQPSGAREGVGSLPGPNAESGVAILPDDRHPDRFQEDAEDSPLPSKEHPSGSRVGVGSLPGKNFEAGVATLPEERINGRPFGQGHTGFEKMLGNKRTHIDIDNPATRSEGQRTPKETIFSATQREMKRDPDFLAHGGAFFQHPHQTNLPSTESVRTFVQGAAGAMYIGAGGLLHGAQGALQSFEQRFKGHDPIQATKDMIQSLEARFGAEDALKHTKEHIQGFEGRIGAGAGDAVQGVKDVIHNLEARFAPAHNPSEAESSSGNVTSGAVSVPQDSSVEQQPCHPASMFVTTGADATTLEMPPSPRYSVPPTPTRKGPPQVPGVPSALPETLQQEYLRSHDRELNEDDLDVGKHETDMFADDGVNSARASIPGDSGAEEMPTSDDRDLPGIKGGDVARGLKGVQYHTQAQGGILPGYPTSEGMAALIHGRLKDDQARNTAAGDNASVLSDTNTTRSGRARLLRDDPAASAEAVRGSYSSEFLPSTSDSPDPSVDDCIIEERREIPVFEGGSIHPDGKYEAVFRSTSDHPEELVASSALHQAHQHHDFHRPSRSSETKDLSGQFAHPHHQKPPLSSLGGEHVGNEQVSRTDHLNEVVERTTFLGQSGDTAARKYDATYRLAGMPSVQIPSTDMPTLGVPSLATRSLDSDVKRFRSEQLMKTNHPNEIEGRPDFRGQSAVTAFGKYDATYHPAGMLPRPFVADGKELRNEQFVRTDHPTGIDKRPDFLGQAGNTAADKYEAAYRLAGIPPSTGAGPRAKQADQHPPTRLPQLSDQCGAEQVVKTNHLNEINEQPSCVDRTTETAAGKFEATFHLAGMDPDSDQVPVSHSRRQPAPTGEQGPIFTGDSEASKGRYESAMSAPLDTAKMDIGGTATVQQDGTGLKKEMLAYLGKPLSGKQPVQE